MRDGGSELECYTASGDYVLAAFSFNDVNPYQNILVSNDYFYLLTPKKISFEQNLVRLSLVNQPYLMGKYFPR